MTVAVNPRPSAKTTTTGAAGAAVVVIVWSAGRLGVDVPAYVAAAFVLLATTAVAWFMPSADDPPKH